jgi:hypothetical protein
VPGDARRYNEVVLAATHNSYAGVASGDLGPLRRQLDGGIRFVELDVHDNEFGSYGYRIGHEAPGDGVARGRGNPNTDKLGAWLRAVAAWSDANPRHAPITVALDIKDDLTDNRSFAEGNLARLNAELVGRLPRLYTSEQLGSDPWPGVDDLRGEVIVVLSGEAQTRLAYVRDRGHNPAVAVNAAGHVVEVHDSGGGDLWYWTGEFTTPQQVRWRRHGRYDTGQRPAVALDDAGRVVEVHEDPAGDHQLWYRTGRLTDDLEIKWSSGGGRSFPGEDRGASPSVRFVVEAPNRVREVHQSEETGQHWYWNGQCSSSGTSIAWTRDDADDGRTQDPLFDKGSAASGDRDIAVRTGSHGAFGSDTLLYTAGAGASQRISYEEIAFVEVQRGDQSGLESEGAWFFAASAKDPDARRWAQGWRLGGKLVRLWEFNDPRYGTDPPPSFPATDHPASDWYRTYCAAVGSVS